MMISLILPTYNEKENISGLIDALIQVLGEKEFEIIVVDDDSPDKTWEIVNEKVIQDKRIRLIHRKNKRGLTSALNEGIDSATGDILVWMDSDFQMPPDKVPELINKVECDGYDAAVGSRFVSGGDDCRYDKNAKHEKIVDIHRSLSRFICWFTSVMFCTDHSDWTSGFIAVKKNIFNTVNLKGDYGEYFMYLLHYLIKTGFKVVEVPYKLTPRLKGKSKSSESYLSLGTKGTKYVFAVFWLSLFKKY